MAPREPSSPALRQYLLVLGDNFLFYHSARLIVQGMGDIFIGAVLALLARHGHEKPRGPANNLQVPYQKAVIKSDRDIGLELFFLHRKDPNLGNFHRDLL